MTIYGISQSSGVERRLHIENGGEGILLIIADHVGNKERERISVQPDDLLAAITNPPGSAIEGVGQGAKKMLLDVKINRNEVLLQAGAGDVAVGLDDFQDALEKVIQG